MNILLDLGYYPQLETFIKSHDFAGFEIGRIIRESKKKYVVKGQGGNYHGEISGKLRHEAKIRSDYPAVGDWVAIKMSGKGLFTRLVSRSPTTGKSERVRMAPAIRIGGQPAHSRHLAKSLEQVNEQPKHREVQFQLQDAPGELGHQVRSGLHPHTDHGRGHQYDGHLRSWL